MRGAANESFDKWLNRLGHVAMIIIAIAALIAVLQWNDANRRLVQGGYQALVQGGYEAGERLDLAKLGIDRGPALLVITRSTCSFCTASMPFYRSISGVAIVWLAAAEATTSNREYLVTNGVTVDRVLSAEEAGVTRVRGTPTLILLDVDGVVRNAWLGALGPQEDEQVRTALTSMSRF